jgi:outer membrane protein TolC
MRQISLLLLLFCISLSFAQEQTTRFSLQEAIDYALDNNRQSQNATRNIEAAKQQKWETTASGLPQISAKVDYQNFLKQQVSIIPAEFFGGNAGEFQDVIFGTQQSLNAFATVNQKLFDGSYLVGLQSAKVFLEISKNAKTKTDLEVRKVVIDAYGNVLLAEESITIFERNIAVLEKNLFETTKIYENGLGEEENVEQLQITLSSVQSMLSNTTRLKTLAYQMLNITLGLDVYNPLILTSNLKNLANNNMSLNLLDTEGNPKNTIDYQIAENDTEAKR